MTNINDNIAAAREAAAATAAQQAEPAPGVPATQAPAAAGAVPAASGPITLDDFSSGSMAVDDYLKVKEHGLIIGKLDGLAGSAHVKIDMSEVEPHLAIKANTGEGARYWKTYDGAVTTDGIPWQEAIRQANQMDTTGKTIEPYKSANIPMTVLEDIKTLDGKTVLAKAGTRLGHSLSTTNKKPFDEFLRAIDKAQLDRGSAEVDVNLGVKKRTGNGYTWGVITFELNGEAKAS